MHCALLHDGTRKPERAFRPAVAALLASWLALSSIAAQAEPRQDETTFETPPGDTQNSALVARPKKDKCEEYAKLTGTNQFFCTHYMNERLVEILLISAKNAQTPAAPRRHVRR